MKVLRSLREFRPEHMAMFYGTREEFKIQAPKDSEIVKDVIRHVNNKLNEDLETEMMLIEDTDIDRNLYSFLRTQDILEEGMSFITRYKDDHMERELILDDNAYSVLTRFRLIRMQLKGMEVYAITPLTLALQHGLNYYDYDTLNEYVPEIVVLLENHGFAEEDEIKGR